MAKYLKKFETESQYNTYISGDTVYLPNVSVIVENGGVKYNPLPHDYSKDYLTFEILSDGYVSFNCDFPYSDFYTKTIQYSKNGSEWINLTSDINDNVATAITVDGKSGTYTFGGYDKEMRMFYWEYGNDRLYNEDGEYNISVGNYLVDSNWNGYEVLTVQSGFVGTKINVVGGDTIRFKGDNASYYVTDEYDAVNSLYAACNFNVCGNIMSLINSTGFTTATTLTDDFTFYELFQRCSGLTSARNLIFLATTLANSCYWNMFEDCTSLTTAPELPATELSDGCYQNMFRGCTSLTTAPELPATTLAILCYSEMFFGCTSLATAPELPATTLADNCYYGMFQGCTSLTTPPSVLPATTLANSCCYNMFQGCTSLTTAPELPATTLANYCYYGMFQGCSGLTSAPVLPATTLANSCYYSMFSFCTSLTSAPSVLPATTLANSCYRNMFYGCTALTTAPELPATILANYCYGYMFKNCTSLNSVTCLATDISATNCTRDWLVGVASNGTFTKNSSMSSWPRYPGGIPSGWTVQVAS